MKKGLLLVGIIGILGCILAVTFIKGLAIQDPIPEECTVIELTVNEITEGGVKDIIFKNDDADLYYINRGLERGLTIEGLEAKVLNKKVTLHLANTWIRQSNHIAQLQLGDEVLFTEFN